MIEVGEQRLQGVLWLGTMAATGVVLQQLRLSRCLRHAALWRLRPSPVTSEAEGHVPGELGVTLDGYAVVVLAGGEAVDCNVTK